MRSFADSNCTSAHTARDKRPVRRLRRGPGRSEQSSAMSRACPADGEPSSSLGRLHHHRDAGHRRVGEQLARTAADADRARADRRVPVALRAAPVQRVVGVHQPEPARADGRRPARRGSPSSRPARPGRARPPRRGRCRSRRRPAGGPPARPGRGRGPRRWRRATCRRRRSARSAAAARRPAARRAPAAAARAAGAAPPRTGPRRRRSRRARRRPRSRAAAPRAQVVRDRGDRLLDRRLGGRADVDQERRVDERRARPARRSPAVNSASCVGSPAVSFQPRGLPTKTCTAPGADGVGVGQAALGQAALDLDVRADRRQPECAAAPSERHQDPHRGALVDDLAGRRASAGAPCCRRTASRAP